MAAGVDVLAVDQAGQGEFHAWTGDRRQTLAVKGLCG